VSDRESSQVESAEDGLALQGSYARKSAATVTNCHAILTLLNMSSGGILKEECLLAR